MSLTRTPSSPPLTLNGAPVALDLGDDLVLHTADEVAAALETMVNTLVDDELVGAAWLRAWEAFVAAGRITPAIREYLTTGQNGRLIPVGA